MVYNAVLATWIVVGSSPEPPPMHGDTPASMWIERGPPC